MKNRPAFRRRWGRPLLGSVAFHTVLLGVIVLALVQRIHFTASFQRIA